MSRIRTRRWFTPHGTSPHACSANVVRKFADRSKTAVVLLSHLPAGWHKVALEPSEVTIYLIRKYPAMRMPGHVLSPFGLLLTK